MKYDRENLHRLAHEALGVARENLQKHGFVESVGLIFHKKGLSHVYQFKYKNHDEKRTSQTVFRDLIQTVGARAVIVVTESWVKTAPKNIDPTKSLEDDPDRKEAIVIEAVSETARIFIMQMFEREGSDSFTFMSPFEPDYRMEWSSEWLDGVLFTKGGDNVH